MINTHQYCDTCSDTLEDNSGCKYCAFSKASALYWFCDFNHDGQWGELYSIQSALGYRPGACERTIDGTNELTIETYRGLHRGTLKPADIAAEIARAYPKDDES